MKKLATLAALTLAGLAAAAPAASATTSAATSPDALGGLSNGLSLSPTDLVIHEARELPLVGKAATEIEAIGTGQLTHPGLSGQIGHGL
ncbi:hypothetical protein ABTX81_20810 [Kitasatospora sp. NPDC097605]|uniref:hypothetical protein n=1 Tax=Kitasatospora sp. NPDC097605 TaxID=3157226 RepID=UPI003327BF40